MWEQVFNSEDPDWQEFKKEVMSARFGRCVLKVWSAYDGYRASITTAKNARYAKPLRSDDIESAKTEASEWSSARLILG